MPVDAHGLDRITEGLRVAGDQLEHLEPAARASATVAAERAETTSPRVTGKLAASVGWAVTAHGWAVTAGARYAAAVHAKNPWMARAVEATTPNTQTEYDKAAQEIVDGIRGA